LTQNSQYDIIFLKSMNFDPLYIILSSAAFGVGAVLGYLSRKRLASLDARFLEQKIREKLAQAENQAEKIILRAKEEAMRIIEDGKRRLDEERAELKKRELRIERERLKLEEEKMLLPKQKKELAENLEKARELKRRLESLEEERRKALEKISGLTKEEAKKLLFEKIEKEFKEDLLSRISKLEKEGYLKYQSRAKEILASVIQKSLPSFLNELTTTQVALPSDDLKGRIIGKEGRNVRTFEEKTGVQIIIDDTPGVVFLSSFDPQRREIAKIVLENLIKDGRIQPSRIEKEVENIEKKLPEILERIGRETAQELQIFDLPSEIHQLLGKLKLRQSFGQNVLAHSVEVAILAERLAQEIGGDPKIAKKAGLLHDIGKAVDQKVEGSHVEIGAKILEKFGIEKEVIEAIKAHHFEYPFSSIEAVLVQVADAISSSRPGARKETEEFYFQRIESLEKVAKSFPEVKKAWVVEAGRELRVFVDAKEVDELEGRNLAREIAKKIEEEVEYPGEIKVVLIRESRIIEYAR